MAAPTMTPRRWSLSLLLMVWTGGTSFLLVGLAVLVLYWTLLDHLARDDESYLTDKIQVLRHQLTSADRNRILDAVVSDPSVRVNSKVYVGITDDSRHLVMATPGFVPILDDITFPDPHGGDLAPATLARHRGLGRDGRRYRLATGSFTQPDGRTGVIEVAYYNRQAELLISNYREWLLAVLISTAGACVLLGYLMARRGLRPIERLTRLTSAVTTSRMDARMDTVGLPEELLSLSSSINAMMARLEDAFARLSRFSSDIAHELRTPLNNIMGMLEVSLQRERASAEYRDTLSSSLEESQRLARLIESLLFLARAEDPANAIVRAEFDLAATLQRMLSFYVTAAEEAGVQLELTVAGPLAMSGDRLLLQRAVGNLLENALAFTPTGGHIAVTALAQGREIRLLVRDDGRGIEAQHLPHIFDRLYRADPSRTSSHHAGLGLGLAMVQIIVRLHGGSVQAASTVGAGTTVTMVLPDGLEADNTVM